MERKWWMSAIGYQIYPRTFYDSNKDGIGDLQGIIQKLDYIRALGVNLIWIGPFYKSPMDDNGYDVSNYFDVDPVFGTLDDARELISEAHKRDIKVVLDLVLNHTSDEHAWFAESRSSLDNPKRDYYIWQKGKLDEKGKLVPPNNWGSFFEGSAWNYDEQSKEFYMKIFSNKMPDLNWDNPKLRDEMYHVARYWLDMGVDGFRVDAIAHLARDLSFEDSELPLNIHGVAPDWSKFSNRKELFTYINEFHEKVLSHYDCMTVGEVGGGAKIEAGLGYAAYDAKAFNMAFNFDHCWETSQVVDPITSEIKNVTNVKNLKQIFNYWINGMEDKGWLPQYWLNHDHPRVISQYGDPKNFHRESGTMLGTVLLTLPGTPFIYNGEEIGMTNVDYTDVNDFNDVWVKNNIKKLLEHETMESIMDKLRRTSRDNARTPMQWTDDKYAGFSTVLPIQKEVSNYINVNVKKQESDDKSILNTYRKLTHLRRFSDYSETLVYGKFRLINPEDENVFAYERYDSNKKLIIITNFRSYTVPFEYQQDVRIIYSNYDRTDKNVTQLEPFEAVILEKIYD
jgi:glycosidase